MKLKGSKFFFLLKKRISCISLELQYYLYLTDFHVKRLCVKRFPPYNIAKSIKIFQYEKKNWICAIYEKKIHTRYETFPFQKQNDNIFPQLSISEPQFRNIQKKIQQRKK